MSAKINTATNGPTRPQPPEESRRNLHRIDVRQGDGVSALIEIPHFNDPIEVRVYDLSIFGICFYVDKSSFEHIHQYQKFKITLKRSWAEDLPVQCTCMWKDENDLNSLRVGFRIDDHLNKKQMPISQDNTESLSVPESTHLIGYIYKDIFYNERVSVRIRSIGKSKLTLEISDTELFIAPQMPIEIFLAVNTSRSYPINGKVNSIQVSGKRAYVTINIEPLNKKLERDLIAHLSFDPTISPAMLAKAGFIVKQLANNYRFRFLKDNSQYEDVLALRFEAYKVSGKVDATTGVQDMKAPLDSVSRILVAYHDNKIVASVAMAFPSTDDFEVETELALENGYPADMPRKTKIIEIARLCVHPDYRKGDLLLRMFEQIYRVFLVSDRDYLVSSTDRKLWSIYKGIGFKKTGYKYEHPYLKGIEHEIIIVNKQLGIHSKGLNPLHWNVLYRKMNEFMGSRLQTRIGFFKNIKITLLTWLGKILRIREDDKY